MNRYEFLSSLERYLVRLPKADRDDILSDYESHFARGIESGKTEEEISDQLGDPAALAAVYLENLPADAKGAPVQQPVYQQPVYQQSAPSSKASRYNTENLIIYILLCIFAFVPIASTIIGVLIGLIGTVIGLIIGTFAVIAGGAAAISLSVVGGIGIIFVGIALAMLAGLAIVAVIAAIKGIVRLVDWFIKWSRDFISPVYGS